MTVFLRDASDFDASVDFTGLAGFTHKATEGISVLHQQYGPRLAAARDAGVPVLGSYHVVRTPNGANGTLGEQLAYWVSYMDTQTPWWRVWPHWVLQIDAEKWPYDNVSAVTVLQFASLLATSGLPGWKVTYASRGQYGDTLTGIPTPLWNADYRQGLTGYPGDFWTSYNGVPAGWAAYAGRTPALLQYTSTPYDMNAYRGSLDDLLNLTGGTTMAGMLDDPQHADALVWRVAALVQGSDTVQGGPTKGEPVGAWAKLTAPVPVDTHALAADIVSQLAAAGTQAGGLTADEVRATVKQVLDAKLAAAQAA